MIASIFNYTTGEIIIKNVPKKLESLSGEEIIDKMGYKSDEVAYMLNDETLDIIYSMNNFTGVLTLK